MLKIIEHLHHQKIVCVCVCACVCVYKMLTYSIKTWTKIGVEAVKYNGKKWINEKTLETALGYKNLVGNKTQYYSDKFKKERHEIQDCEDFQALENLLGKN